jgi:hypothetical protein
MYHETKMIDGVTNYRTSPSDPFEPYTERQLSLQVEHLLNALKALRSDNEELRRANK